MEEITKELSENGVGGVVADAMAAMDALGMNAQGIIDTIILLRQLYSLSHDPLPFP